MQNLVDFIYKVLYYTNVFIWLTQGYERCVVLPIIP